MDNEDYLENLSIKTKNSIKKFNYFDKNKFFHNSFTNLAK